MAEILFYSTLPPPPGLFCVWDWWSLLLFQSYQWNKACGFGVFQIRICLKIVAASAKRHLRRYAVRVRYWAEQPNLACFRNKVKEKRKGNLSMPFCNWRYDPLPSFRQENPEGHIKQQRKTCPPITAECKLNATYCRSSAQVLFRNRFSHRLPFLCSEVLKEIPTSVASFAPPSWRAGTYIWAHASPSIDAHWVTDTCNQSTFRNYLMPSIKSDRVS